MFIYDGFGSEMTDTSVPLPIPSLLLIEVTATEGFETTPPLAAGWGPVKDGIKFPFLLPKK